MDVDIAKIQARIDELNRKRGELYAELRKAKAQTEPQLSTDGDIDAAMREYAEWTQRERALTLLIAAVDNQLIPAQTALREAKEAQTRAQLAEVEEEVEPAARAVVETFLSFAEALSGFGMVCEAMRSLGGAPHLQLVGAELRKAMAHQRNKFEGDAWLPEEVRALLPNNIDFLRHYRP